MTDRGRRELEQWAREISRRSDELAEVLVARMQAALDLGARRRANMYRDRDIAETRQSCS